MALAEDSVPVFPFHSDVQACEILQQRCMNARADAVFGQNLERQQVFLQNMAFMRDYRSEIETFIPNGVVFQPPFAYRAQPVCREVKGFEQSRPRPRSGKLFDPRNAFRFENRNEGDLAKNGNGRGSVKNDGNGNGYANGRKGDGNGNGNGRSDGNGKGNGRRSDGNGNGNGCGSGRSDGNGSVPFRCEMNELEDLLSKLNPMAEEFVPPSLAREAPLSVSLAFESFVSNGLCYDSVSESEDYSTNGRQKKNGRQGKKKANRTSLAQQEDSIRRTVYVSDIDHQVTEEQLAALFITCGQVVDCRICGDPNSVLRFAFVEFTDEDGARAALSLAGTMLGYYPVRVLPSKTAIAPVNPTFLPRSAIEREMCARTVYCTNIDKKVCQTDVKIFFETICGEVSRLRLLGDYQHSTRIAFVEFVRADSATAALDCSGAILGSLAIRVSPSKTPVRARPPRSLIHENGRAH